MIDAPAATIDDLVNFYLGNLDRPVVNRTGISGRFDIHLEFTSDEPTAQRLREPGTIPGVATADPSGPTIFF